MYIIGLTGGIGSGKSEAAKQFARLGVPVVDTDVIAHALTAAGTPELEAIAQAFGAGFLNADGSLNRPRLRAHILGNTSERMKLEAILHPAIYRQAVSQLEQNQKTLHPDYQILAVPLMFENDRYQSIVNKTLVIDCDESLQIKRAMARSQLSQDEVIAMMQAQTTRNVRLQRADEIIENNGTLDDLAEKINKLHKKIIKTCIVSK